MIDIDNSLESRILVSNKKKETEFREGKSKITTKGKKYKPSCKRGKLCGSKHMAICPETRENFRKSMLLNFKRRDPFFMVDGVITEEQKIDPVNTNSGVLCEDDLIYLQ